MKTKEYIKLVREGRYVAEVEVVLAETDDGWSPYLSPDDVAKLDVVRDTLRRGDIQSASRLSHVYLLTPVAA